MLTNQPRSAEDYMIISLLKPLIDKQCFRYRFSENLPKIITRRAPNRRDLF